MVGGTSLLVRDQSSTNSGGGKKKGKANIEGACQGTSWRKGRSCGGIKVSSGVAAGLEVEGGVGGKERLPGS